METIELFKGDLWNGIFQHARRILRPTLAFTVVYMLLLITLLATVFFVFMDMGALQAFVENSSNSTDIFETQRQNQKIMRDLMENIGVGRMVTFVIMLYGILFIIGSWFMNLMLITSESVILHGSANLGECFKKSFNKDVFKLIGLVLILAVLSGILAFGAATLVAVNFALMLVAFMLIVMIMNRFAGAPGAIVHGKMGVLDSLAFSWKNITFGKGAILFLVMIVIAIILGLVNLLNMGLGGLLGGAGAIISFIIQIAITVYMYAFIYAGLSAAFYRYADVQFEDSEAEHLITESE